MSDRSRFHPKGRGTVCRATALFGLVLLTSCAAIRSDLATPVATGVVITDLRSAPAENPAFTDVSGVVVNNRSTPVSQVKVQVQQLDVANQVIDSVPAVLSSGTIPPNGGRAQFSARMSTQHLATYGAVAEVP